MEQSSLTFKTLKNITYNIIGYLWPILFTLLITPRVVLKLGIKEYGVYIFATAALTLLGLLDLGLSVAVNKHLSYYYGKKDTGAMNRLVHSANSLYFLVGTAGFLLTCLVIFGGTHFLPEKFLTYRQYSSLF